MPNRVYQDLHVVGPKAEVDRFVRTGFMPCKTDDMEDVLDWEALLYAFEAPRPLRDLTARGAEVIGRAPDARPQDADYSVLGTLERRLGAILDSLQKDLNTPGCEVLICKSWSVRIIGLDGM